ncbi:glycosyltransferase family 4 protein [Nitrosomonas marina]|uniref:Glycosyltransferase involved in cell wall bisynthesis n=1 Tax=Nitrosomonas marina TaxID=917 RepID=A0A1H8E2B2_9PROT|nr:glycosyltransferase family 4 protein [Nitrosomonas marina]SEN13575.1 Glycosyltransferase involved in cell wall bisynthesis [Nitrosomonas marina]
MKNTLLSLNTYNYRRGGSDAVFFDHQKLFQELEWNTVAFTMRHPKNEVSEWEQYFVDELEFGNNYSILQKIVMAGKVIYSWEASANLKRLIQHVRPDIAHAHCIYHHLSPSVLNVLSEAGIPAVMTAHDLKLACPAYKMLNKTGVCERCKDGNLWHVVKNRCIHDSLAASMLVSVESSAHKLLGLYKKNLDKIITPSQFYRTKLIEWGWHPNKLVYIPNFIHYQSYAPQYKAGEYFLYFGRLAPEKGVDTLIKAALMTGVKLKLAGTGPDEKKLHRLVPEGCNTIEFLGYRSGDTLKSLIQHARAVVLPSQWYENAPISILESYACGKPVIGSWIGGIPEMLKPGETGFLFETGNVAALSELLQDFESMADSRLEEMGRAAHNFATSAFTVDRYLENMCSLYQSLGVRFLN